MRTTSTGQVSFAFSDGVYVLKFKGDIRFQICASVDRFIQKIFHESEHATVIVDLTEASAVDSTALGVLAQIAIHTRRAQDTRPTILVNAPDMLAVLRAVSFDKVFHLLPNATASIASPSKSYGVVAGKSAFVSRRHASARSGFGAIAPPQACTLPFFLLLKSRVKIWLGRLFDRLRFSLN